MATECDVSKPCRFNRGMSRRTRRSTSLVACYQDRYRPPMVLHLPQDTKLKTLFHCQDTEPQAVQQCEDAEQQCEDVELKIPSVQQQCEGVEQKAPKQYQHEQEMKLLQYPDEEQEKKPHQYQDEEQQTAQQYQDEKAAPEQYQDEEQKTPEQCQDEEQKAPKQYQDEEQKAPNQYQDEEQKTPDQYQDEEQKTPEQYQDEEQKTPELNEEQKTPELNQDEEKTGKQCQEEDKTSVQHQDEEQKAQQEECQDTEQKSLEQPQTIKKPITLPSFNDAPRSFSLQELIQEKQLVTGEAKATSKFSQGKNAITDHRAPGAAAGTGSTTLAMVIRRPDGGKKPTGIIRRCVKALNQMIKTKHGSKKSVPFKEV